jgi:chromosome segregation ATPase
MRYEPVENFFLQIVGANADKFFVEDETLTKQLQAKRGQLKELETKIDKLTDAILEAQTAPAALVKKQAEMEKDAERIKREIEILQPKLSPKKKTKLSAKDIIQVTHDELAANQKIREGFRQFLLDNVERMTFSLDRNNIGFQFKNEEVNKTLSDYVKQKLA